MEQKGNTKCASKICKELRNLSRSFWK